MSTAELLSGHIHDIFATDNQTVGQMRRRVCSYVTGTNLMLVLKFPLACLAYAHLVPLLEPRDQSNIGPNSMADTSFSLSLPNRTLILVI